MEMERFIYYVGGLAKSAIRRAVGTGEFFAHVGDVAEYLQMKFDGHSNPVHYIKEIDAPRVDFAR